MGAQRQIYAFHRGFWIPDVSRLAGSHSELAFDGGSHGEFCTTSFCTAVTRSKDSLRVKFCISFKRAFGVTEGRLGMKLLTLCAMTVWQVQMDCGAFVDRHLWTKSRRSNRRITTQSSIPECSMLGVLDNQTRSFLFGPGERTIASSCVKGATFAPKINCNGPTSIQTPAKQTWKVTFLQSCSSECTQWTATWATQTSPLLLSHHFVIA